MKKEMCCHPNCGPWGWLILVIGVLYLGADLHWWSWWTLSWWTVASLVIGGKVIWLSQQ